jgi:hypothetical protein
MEVRMELILNLQRLAPATGGFELAFNSTNSQICSSVSNQNCTNTQQPELAGG